MTPERARNIAQACADTWYGGAAGMNLKEAIAQGIMEACAEQAADLRAVREDLRLQNEANDMIATERDAYRAARDEARLLFNKEYNEANESRRRLKADLAAARADAERYRWIRDNHEVPGRAMEIVYGLNGCDWDAAIDAELTRRSGR